MQYNPDRVHFRIIEFIPVYHATRGETGAPRRPEIDGKPANDIAIDPWTPVAGELLHDLDESLTLIDDVIRTQYRQRDIVEEMNDRLDRMREDYRRDLIVEMEDLAVAALEEIEEIRLFIDQKNTTWTRTRGQLQNASTNSEVVDRALVVSNASIERINSDVLPRVHELERYFSGVLDQD